MRDHDDKAVFGDLLEQLHDLDARLGVERAGGFVGQQHVGVVDQGARDGHALHLPARELVGQLVEMLAQADLLQRRDRALAALGAGDAGDGQREFDIRQNRLVRDEVIALEDKADRVVAVGVPVAVGVLFGRYAVYDKVAAVVAVQPADNVEQRRLAGAGRPEDGDELAVAEAHIHMIERFLHQRTGAVFFADLFDLQHWILPAMPRMAPKRRSAIKPYIKP